MKSEHPRNVWLTLTIFVRKFELSFIFHPFYCGAQFLPIFPMVIIQVARNSIIVQLIVTDKVFFGAIFFKLSDIN